MSKMNRIRIMNLNYNNNAIRIDDEIFDLNGESTLLSLRNGGGKTVFVQMIISLFVNESFRDFPNRKFESYFTTNKPTFIMTEWKLDHNSGYFLVGMMVRKAIDTDENNDKQLEIINFTGSYRKRCDYSIDCFPVVEIGEKGKILKGFGACKKVFENLKKADGDFNYYDMTSQYYRRSYFDKLKEYQVNNKEWESVIKKINLKESGLSELFKQSKDERGLIENWFLNTIENKLKVSNNRIKKFQENTKQFIQQYKKNETSVKRKAIMEQYFEDAKEIEKQISQYQNIQEDYEKKVSVIASFIEQMDVLIQKVENQIALADQELENCEKKISRVKHEKYSYAYHKENQKKKELSKERVGNEMMLTQARRTENDARKKIALCKCARDYEECLGFQSDISQIQEKMDHIYSQQKDNEEEVIRLGSLLYMYFENKVNEFQKVMNLLQDENSELKQRIKDGQEDYDAKMHTINLCMQKKGSLDSKIQQFDRVENRFNKKYKEKLVRNILGQYEEGQLELSKRKTADELICIHTKIKDGGEQLNKNEEASEETERCVSQKSVEKTQVSMRIEQLGNEIKGLTDEKNNRIIYIKYVDLTEADVDDKEKIISCFNVKIKNAEQENDQFKAELLSCKKEYDNLKQGRTIELPQNIVSYFELHKINYTYGMEWLRKNERSAEDNQRLVDENPFIPYSIIVDRQSYERMNLQEDEVYTSFPIPVIIRENMENAMMADTKGLINLEKISFFVMFNKHLLNMDELKALLEETQEKIHNFEKKIDNKNVELEKYRGYLEAIRNQSYSEKKLAGTLDLSKRKQENLQKLEKEIENLMQKKIALREEKSNLQKQVNEWKKQESINQRKQEDMEELEKAYEEYQQNLNNRQIIERKQQETAKEAKERKSQLNQDEKQLTNNKIQFETVLHDQRDANGEKISFETFAKNASLLNEKCPDDMEYAVIKSKYVSYTKGVHDSIEQLEEELKSKRLRLERMQKDLQNDNSYNFKEEEYGNSENRSIDINYYREQIEEQTKIEDKIDNRNMELNSEMATCDAEMKNIVKNILDETGSEERISAEQITDIQFDKRIKLLKYEFAKCNKTKDEYNNKKQLFDHAIAAMEEYTEFQKIKETSLPELETMTKDEFKNYHITIRKELKHAEHMKEKEKNETEKILRNLSLKKIYQDDFFIKCFNRMLSVSENIYTLKEQYEIINSAYMSLLEKLKVDLEMVDKERQNLEENYMEYVRSLDDNMRLIDKNSTINIRGRSLKMLKIEVPDWDVYRSQYELKLHDYVDQVIKRCVKAIDVGENIDEVIGNMVTTRNLYDSVIGISNIGIKLYKIEEQREVPITWNQVSSNSGGEGFLSAFVILVCLLSYMRRDEGDVFSMGEEGKVLIMDNPFAQTNAEHLLKPLMDLANRMNTQLICLSGLGGESIYNRFENIYVLKLVKSVLNQGKMYMHADHVKGDIGQSMQLSQFEFEQTTLF